MRCSGRQNFPVASVSAVRGAAAGSFAGTSDTLTPDESELPSSRTEAQFPVAPASTMPPSSPQRLASFSPSELDSFWKQPVHATASKEVTAAGIKRRIDAQYA